MANKRILIFSPELKDQTRIEVEIQNNLKDILDMYYGEIVIQKFRNASESLRRGLNVGIGGEIFAIFDRYLEISGKRIYNFTANYNRGEYKRQRGLFHVQEITKNICAENLIPFIEYEGEIGLGKVGSFRNKIQVIKPGILARILEVDSVMHNPFLFNPPVEVDPILR